MNKLILTFAFAFLALLTSCSNTDTVDPQDSDFVFYESIYDKHITVVDPKEPKSAYNFYPNYILSRYNTPVTSLGDGLYSLNVAGPDKLCKKTSGLILMQAGTYTIESVSIMGTYLNTSEYKDLKSTTVDISLNSIKFSALDIVLQQSARIAHLFVDKNRKNCVIYGDQAKQELYIFVTNRGNGEDLETRDRVTLKLSKK